MTTVAAILGALGLVFIFAGPAFHFIPTTTGIFLALVSWIVGGLLRGLSKKEGGEKEEKEEEKKEEKGKEKEEKKGEED